MSKQLQLWLLALFISSAASGQTTRSNAPGSAPASAASQPAPPDDFQWPMATKDYANIRYSSLDQIKIDNVKNLQCAWTFSTAVNRGHEAAPLVIGDTMYVITPSPNVLYALDLKNNGLMKWKYEPKPSSGAQGVACCDVVCRGGTHGEGRICVNA